MDFPVPFFTCTPNKNPSIHGAVTAKIYLMKSEMAAASFFDVGRMPMWSRDPFSVGVLYLREKFELIYQSEVLAIFPNYKMAAVCRFRICMVTSHGHPP